MDNARRPARISGTLDAVGSTTPSAPSAARATRRLVLRPGTHVLRRSASELQVGLDPRRAVVLPDHPGVRALLARLARPAARPSEEPYDGQALDALTGSGLLMDLDTLLPLMPSPPRHGDIEAAACISRTAVAALAADVGTGRPPCSPAAPGCASRC